MAKALRLQVEVRRLLSLPKNKSNVQSDRYRPSMTLYQFLLACPVTSTIHDLRMLITTKITKLYNVQIVIAGLRNHNDMDLDDDDLVDLLLVDQSTVRAIMISAQTESIKRSLQEEEHEEFQETMVKRLRQESDVAHSKLSEQCTQTRQTERISKNEETVNHDISMVQVETVNHDISHVEIGQDFLPIQNDQVDTVFESDRKENLLEEQATQISEEKPKKKKKKSNVEKKQKGSKTKSRTIDSSENVQQEVQLEMTKEDDFETTQQEKIVVEVTEQETITEKLPIEDDQLTETVETQAEVNEEEQKDEIVVDIEVKKPVKEKKKRKSGKIRKEKKKSFAPESELKEDEMNTSSMDTSPAEMSIVEIEPTHPKEDQEIIIEQIKELMPLEVDMDVDQGEDIHDNDITPVTRESEKPHVTLIIEEIIVSKQEAMNIATIAMEEMKPEQKESHSTDESDISGEESSDEKVKMELPSVANLLPQRKRRFTLIPETPAPEYTKTLRLTPEPVASKKNDESESDSDESDVEVFSSKIFGDRPTAPTPKKILKAPSVSQKLNDSIFDIPFHEE